MNPFMFFIVFLLSFPNPSWGGFTQDEIKRAWKDVGYNIEVWFLAVNANYCYESERRFTGCLMSFNQLLLTAMEDEPYQLAVSDSNSLQITPLSKSDRLEFENSMELKAERRESFRLLFRTQLPSTGHFNDTIEKIQELTKKVPLEDQGRLIGEINNFFLKESFDPHSSMIPLVLAKPKFNENSIGIGADYQLYRMEDGKTSLAVRPVIGSPAEQAGLRKGDLILSIDGFDIRELPLSLKTFKDLFSRIEGPQGSHVELKILSLCDNEEKGVTVTRDRILYPTHWIFNRRFMSLIRPEEPLGCETEIQMQTRIESLEAQPGSSVEPAALYVHLRQFETEKNPETDKMIASLRPFIQNIGEFPLCAEFIHLQLRDLTNPYSRGMILDLRGNHGGYLHEVSCMLNTIIESNGIIMDQLPVVEGEIISETVSENETIAYYFTKGGVPMFPLFSSPVIYNRSIVVLVDEMSASGSELFAGTIQDMRRGWVIGSRTVGKGSMQDFFNFQMENPNTGKTFEYIHFIMTTGIFTLNSGRSPQGYGIIPDFHFSPTGEPIENKGNYVSILSQTFLNDIEFENPPWEQNRPNELAKVSECVHKADRMGQILKEKMQRDKRYARTFAGDYYLELAKDVLMCSGKRSDTIPQPYLMLPFLNKEMKKHIDDRKAEDT